MADYAIRVDGLGKRYHLGMAEHHLSLREVLTDAMARPFRAATAVIRGQWSRSATGRTSNETFWALKDVSCEVTRGMVVGIIGSNGAGKSTLLKILSRITTPTEGSAALRGRLGSLLEVGTGFHPELTGRENILLNGTILGMKRAEIRRRFDEIVAFAEVERFIDTPVKHYSSGMYVRLAFSVAAHLDVDLLAVDEVLAVGDASFQQKCLGKLQEIRGGQGRTVLFVSHNMGAIRLLSDACLLLNAGRLVEFGKTEEVVNRYLRTSLHADHQGSVDLSRSQVRCGVQKQPELNVVFTSLRLLNQGGQTTNVFFEREPITIELMVRSKIRAKALECIVVVVNLDGAVVFSSFSGPRFRQIEQGTYRIISHFNPNILRPGHYRLRLYLSNVQWQDVIPEALVFHIQPNPTDGTSLRYSTQHPGLLGLVHVEYPWSDVVEVPEEGAILESVPS